MEYYVTPEFKFALREDLKDNKEFLPAKSEPNATGYDCKAAFLDKKDLVIKPGQYFKIPLGFRCHCPEGWYYQLHPRSSSFVKKHMHNLIGIIDQDFPLELIFAGQYVPDSSNFSNDLVIKYGDTIAQIVPTKRVDMVTTEITNNEYDKLHISKKSIRVGGFGSTDKLK